MFNRSKVVKSLMQSQEMRPDQFYDDSRAVTLGSNTSAQQFEVLLNYLIMGSPYVALSLL